MKIKNPLPPLQDYLRNPDFWVLFVTIVLAPIVVFN